MTTHHRPKTILWSIFLAAVLVYLMTAYNSVGFHHADEHYQVIEFAMTKIEGKTPPKMAWEYAARIRPALQPSFAVGTLSFLSTLGVEDPYTQTVILRLLSALFALLTISSFIRNTEHLITDRKLIPVYHLLSYFLWFIPYVSVRFSSETWSGLFFLWALGMVFRWDGRMKSSWILGLLFGMSFLYRFQMAIAIAGLVLWMMFFRRLALTGLWRIAAGFSLAALLGVFVDSWFYGEWVFTPWKYFEVNILKDAASGFGTSPWYYYFAEILRSSFIVIGIPMAILLLLFGMRRPKSPIVWVVIPFMVVHILIPHKELRFLFPLVYLIPLAMTLAIEPIAIWLSEKKWIRVMTMALLLPLLAIDLLCVAVVSQVPAGMGRMAITREIHQRFGEEEIALTATSFSNPYDPWHSAPVSFYSEDEMTSTRISTLCELAEVAFIPDAVNLLVVRKSDFGNPECQGPRGSDRYERICQSEPQWTEKLGGLAGMDDDTQVMVLYRWLGPGGADPTTEQ